MAPPASASASASASAPADAAHPNPAAAPCIDDATALVVVDVQYGFMPGGGLAVPDGDAVVAVVNRIAPRFANAVLTQDWHPPGHASFASSHAGQSPFAVIALGYGDQVLWPDHCVQGTHDAALHADLRVPQAQLVIRKGYHRGIDSYSAFREADRTTQTGLDGYLRQRGIRRLYVCGLATDFCVAWTAIDAAEAGYETWVVEDATRPIDTQGSLAAAWLAMTAAGVRRIGSGALPEGC